MISVRRVRFPSTSANFCSLIRFGLTIQCTCYRQCMSVDVELFPIIGEPFAVELANTLYARPGAETDFLDDGAWVVAWFDEVDRDGSYPMPRRLTAERVTTVQSLRNAIHAALLATTNHCRIPESAVDTLNEFAGSMPCRYRLEYAEPPVVTITPIGRGFDATLASLAMMCLSFLAGPDLSRVRRCDGPDCPMFFVQHHHKRRFCYDGCAHRARQARYYRSLRA
jgi:predicted RNA-binding Zn ribbon-like protein